MNRPPWWAVVAVVVLVLASCARAPSSEKKAPAASVEKKAGEGDLVRITLTREAEARLGILLSRVELRSVPQKRFAPGELVVPSGSSLQLAAPVAATVLAGSRVVAAGSAVKRGDLLVTLVPIAPVDRDVRAQAERQVSAAAARYATAKARYERSEKLLKDGAASLRSVEEAREGQDVAKAELVAAEGRARTLLSAPLGADVLVSIRAPHDGVVQRVGASSGQSVAAGTLLAEVVGTSALWVRVPVFVAEARRVKLDAPAKVFPFGEGQPQEALPAHAPPFADPLNATVDLTYELSGAHGFLPGERVRVELSYGGEGPELVVPVSSVVRDAGGGSWVYEALGGSVFARRRVDPLRQEGAELVLARGPRAGVEIVREGAMELFGVEFGAGK